MPEHFRFAGSARDLYRENHIQLTSVGIDIGSSTTLIVFSCLDLERENSRYVTVNRKILYESEILEIKGEGEVEKVLVHDLNEDEEYELFIDSIIIL